MTSFQLPDCNQFADYKYRLERKQASKENPPPLPTYIAWCGSVREC